MAEDEPPVLQRNGKVALTIEGKKFEWRRPKAKEYRQLTEKSLELADMQPEKKDGESDNQYNLRVMDIAIEATSNWFTTAHKLLCDKPLPDNILEDDEELPAWVLDGDFIARVLKHFTEVPKVAPGR